MHLYIPRAHVPASHSLYLAGRVAGKMELTRRCLLCWRCCLLAFLYFTNTVHSVHGLSLHIPQSQLHQLLPLGTNATVQCIPEPPESRPTITWAVDGGLQYEKFISFYNSLGIFVYQTADNISYVVVEGRPGQKNRKLACGAVDDNGGPVVSDIAMIEFYGPPTPPSGLTVNTFSALSPLLSWNTSHGENITYQLKVLQAAGSVSGGVVTVNVSTTSHLLRVPQAERCTEHEFLVRAVNPAGTSNYSDPITAFVPDVPAAVDRFYIEVLSLANTSSVVITFSPTSCGNYTTQYIAILVRRNSTTMVPLNTTSSPMSTSSSAELSGLMKDAIYNLTLEAHNMFGASHSNTTTVYTTDVQRADILITSSEAIVTCHFATGASAKGCLLTVHGRTIRFNVTIQRNRSALLASGTVTLPRDTPISELEFQVFSYIRDGVFGSVPVLASSKYQLSPSNTSTTHGSASASSTSAAVFSIIETPTPTVSTREPISLSTHQIVTIVVPVGVALIIVIIIILLVAVFSRQWRRRKQKGSSPVSSIQIDSSSPNGLA